MPIHELLKVFELEVPQAVRDAISGLIINPLIVVSLGLSGEDRNQFTAVYFPESGFAVNRISFPGTFSPHNVPSGTHSVQAEITCRRDAEVWRASDADVRDHVIDGLVTRGIIQSPGAVWHSSVVRRPYSYAVYDVGYERRAELVREWFSG